MPEKVLKGYSFLIRPLVILLDITVLCLCAYYLLGKSQNIYFYGYLTFGWIAASVWVRFYSVYRFTSEIRIFKLLVKQAFLLIFILFSYFGIVLSRNISIYQVMLFIILVMGIIGVFKYSIYFLLKAYRRYYGGNVRRILVFGNSKQTKELIKFFKSKPEIGYHIRGIYNNETFDKGIEDLKENPADEVYCAIDEPSSSQINDIVNLCESFGTVLKFIPNVEKVPVSNFKTHYYDYQPVLSIPKLPLHDTTNVIVKRLLDVLISVLVIVGILSWLTPLLYIIIKLESKGPLIYAHKRNGVNYREFTCYKFRSLREEGNRNRLHVSEEDERVTKVGRFLRRTSIDEIPQFINVLKGDMSVVGPRPHIPRYTEAYAQKTNKYQFVFRHSVRPGITGLAQIKGYRGEIKSDEDIINRIKYDVYYIENWSTLMDVKIMFSTLVILIKGHEKAY